MVHSIDVDDMVPLVADRSRQHAQWQRAADDLANDGKAGAAIMAAVRAAGAGGSPDTLRGLISKHATEIETWKREDFNRQSALVVDAVKRLGPDCAAVAWALMDGLLAGGDPGYHFWVLAQTLDQFQARTAALDVIRGAIALDPDRGWYQDTHALVLMSLGRWDEAGQAVDRLAAYDVGKAAWLRTYLGALTTRFDFWPAVDPATELHLGGYIPRPARTPAEAADAIRTAAGRVDAVREALVQQVGEVSWLPDSGLVAGAEVGSDPIDWGLADASLPNLLLLLRREWSRLTWLCYAAGLDEITLPEEGELTGRPLELVGALLTVRGLALRDIAGLGTPNADDLAGRQMAKSTWGGTPILELAPHLARIAIAEQLAALAAVRWMFKADAGWPFPRGA